MTVTVDFIFDVTSPNVYLVNKCIPDIEKRTGVQFNYIPCLLGGIFKATGNQAPIFSMSNVKGRFEYERVEFMRFIKKHELFQFKMNSAFPVNTVLAQRVALVADQSGELRPFVDAALTAIWENNIKLDNAETITDIANAAGLNGQQLVEGAQADEIKAKLLSNSNAAVDRGCFGAPTFYVGEEMFFGKNTLQDVEDEIIAQS